MRYNAQKITKKKGRKDWQNSLDSNISLARLPF